MKLSIAEKRRLLLVKTCCHSWLSDGNGSNRHSNCETEMKSDTDDDDNKKKR